MSSSGPKSIPLRIYKFLSGFGLATALLVILMVETWLATLEQVHFGLHATLQKYFTPEAVFVFPDAAERKKNVEHTIKCMELCYAMGIPCLRLNTGHPWSEAQAFAYRLLGRLAKG